MYSHFRNPCDFGTSAHTLGVQSSLLCWLREGKWHFSATVAEDHRSGSTHPFRGTAFSLILPCLCPSIILVLQGTFPQDSAGQHQESLSIEKSKVDVERDRINQADSLQPLGTKLQGSFSEPFCKRDTGEFARSWYPHRPSIYPNRENIHPFCGRCPVGYAMFFQLLDYYLAVVSEQFANLIVACIK